jgi:hypothetical protein
MLLDRFVFRSETCPKFWGETLISLRFFACAGVMMTVSSANCNVVVWKFGNEIRFLDVRCIRVCKVSVAIMKSNGDKGSPCRKPR